MAKALTVNRGRQQLLFVLVLLAAWPDSLIACGQLVAKSAGKSSGGNTLEHKAFEFRKLRPLRGYFDGQVWNKEVDQWMGRKHRLMVELGSRLGNGQFDSKEIEHLLGPPDRIVRQGHHLYDMIVNLPGYDTATTAPYKFLVYFWRGMHDFLFFTLQDAVTIGSGWWHAGE